MTTSIFSNLIGPVCELFYKYKKSIDIFEANKNTIRNYGFSTTFAINFGFEILQPFSLSDIKLQPGAFTYNSVLQSLPSDVSVSTTISVSNLIVLSDLPTSGIGTLSYEGYTLPLKISLKQNSNSVIGLASNYGTSGIPYKDNNLLDESIIRSFESDLTSDSELSSLIFVYLEDVTFTGINTNWSISPDALYSYDLKSFRFNNGYGQFYSELANKYFTNSILSTSITEYNNLYACTYMNVYNLVNNLEWTPDFLTWYGLNKPLMPEFIQRFLEDYFGVS